MPLNIPPLDTNDLLEEIDKTNFYKIPQNGAVTIVATCNNTVLY